MNRFSLAWCQRMKVTSVFLFVPGIFLGGCASAGNDGPNGKPRVVSEEWKEYTFEWNDVKRDTTSAEGVIVRRKDFDEGGRLRMLTEFQPQSGIYKKVTRFDGNEAIKTIELYYDSSAREGEIEENENNFRGNPIKKVVSNIKGGQRQVIVSFEIANEYDNEGHLVRSTSLSSNDSSKAYVTENTYNGNGEIEYSILTGGDGKIIAEVINRYNEKGKLIFHQFRSPDINTTKEIGIEYIGGLNRIETEKKNGEIQRVSEFVYVNGELTKILADEIERRRKKVVFIDRRHVE